MVVRVWVGAILLRGSSILLGKRAATRQFYPNVWDVFGGHVEPDEAPEQTLVRELQEELGITPTGFTQLTVLRDPDLEQHGAYEYYLYHVTEWTGTPQNILPEEHAEIRWFPLEETLHLDLALSEYQVLFKRLAEGGTAC